VLLSGFILFPLYISSVNAIIPFGVLALGVVLYTLFHPSLRRQAEPAADGEPQGEGDTAPVVGPPVGPDPTEAPGTDASAPTKEGTEGPGRPFGAGIPAATGGASGEL
jgi:hypothetical protein